MNGRFQREDGLFSLCGLNCGLCPMKIRGDCSGCFTDSPCYPSCPIAPCSVRHGNVEYCYQCEKYPCERYDGIDKYDSLITHRNQKKDLMKAREFGIDAYLREQRAKADVLHQLLEEYDDGSKDVFFCLAVNMLPLIELRKLMKEAAAETAGKKKEEKTAYVERKLTDCAGELGIELELRPWSVFRKEKP